MSKQICEYCGQALPADAKTCPHCGAARSGEPPVTKMKIPETIEELQAFCAAHRMPLHTMRFFIGEDFQGPKAFGIYRDAETGSFVVYKNKADGSRAIRYQGPDEKYAVWEIYQKLKSEAKLRQGGSGRGVARNGSSSGDSAASWEAMNPLQRILGTVLVFWKPLLIVLAIVLFFLLWGKQPDRGYYRYQDDTYYFQDSSWYIYDSLLNDWALTYDVPEDLEKNYGDYYESALYDEGYGTTDFSNSVYYSEDTYSADSNYDDYDWDSNDYDSWDSADTDWNSDW